MKINRSSKIESLRNRLPFELSNDKDEDEIWELFWSTFDVGIEHRDARDVPDLIKMCKTAKVITYIYDDTSGWAWLFYNGTEKSFLEKFKNKCIRSQNLSPASKSIIREKINDD